MNQDLHNSEKLLRLFLPIRLARALEKEGIITVSDFMSTNRKRFLKIKNIGTKSVEIFSKIKKEYYVGEPPDKIFNKYFPKNDARKLISIHNAYVELGTLQAVATTLEITRERVRQLLRKGDYLGLFKYETNEKTRMKELVEEISRDYLISEIKLGNNIFTTCSKLDIKMSEYRKLFKHYQIDIGGYTYDARKRKYLIKYSEIVDSLGHHPTTTEMQFRKGWRYTSLAIKKIWGSIEQFRKEFGIEKPSHRIHKNTKIAFSNLTKKRIFEKKRKIEMVLDTVKRFEPISTVSASKKLGIKRQSVLIYLNELLRSGKIKRIGNLSSSKYIKNN